MNWDKISVLLVEDNPGDARLLKEMLREVKGGQFSLVWADRLSAGLERLAEGGIDIVLLDLSLPDSNGLDTLASIQAQAPQFPIIVLTGLNDEALAVRAVREGAQDYLIKGQVDANLLVRAARYAIERKRAEEERRQLQEQLVHAQKIEAIGTLAGGIAHEFNNINGEIIAFIDLTLEMEDLPAAARRNLETIRFSAVAGADLTKSLLAFSRRDIGDRKPVELKDVVNEALRVIEKQFIREGIQLTVKHSPGVPSIMANTYMLESVVMNLAINARHAMLRSAAKCLTVETGIENEKAFIKVEDTGCGIPEEDLSRIFDPFFTTKGALAGGEVYDGKVHGTGLGLSVSHAIIEGHGGEIKVESEVGKGATFMVYLPILENKPEQHAMAQEAGGQDFAYLDRQ